MDINLSLGAVYLGEERCRFRVWAPKAREVQVHLLSPDDRYIPLERVEHGYFQATVENVPPGTRYLYQLDGEKERPDPASRYQPEGVHGPSEVVDLNFTWDDRCWGGLLLQKYIIYELHVGTFTPEGTFDAIIPHLDYLVDLGITAIEIMPVAQFPGARNWGYDGVSLFAVQNSYGGPQGLKRLVDACHQRGLAVVLDVVYNHLGAEGNYLWDYGYYFTEFYKTPWGSAVNFDGPYSDEVRRFFIENALHWTHEFRIDALRLDATDNILDFSVGTFLEELVINVHANSEANNRKVYLIAESDRNDARITRVRDAGGYGLDGQWVDNFHHALHTVLTGESQGYYEDFGDFSQLVKAYREGFVFTGEYSRHRKRRHGSSTFGLPCHRFVVCSQNHDQVGNRMNGDRLGHLVDFEALKVAAASVLLSPFLPLLFMGEEYAEDAPFQYFIDHGDPALVEAVRQGRKEEFAAFKWEAEPPDPYAVETFQRSTLNHALKSEGRHNILCNFYRSLLHLRKNIPALYMLNREQMEVIGYERENVLYIHRWSGDSHIFFVISYSQEAHTVDLPIPMGRWRRILDSKDAQWLPEAAHEEDPIPTLIEIQGRTEFALEPMSVLVFEKV